MLISNVIFGFGFLGRPSKPRIAKRPGPVHTGPGLCLPLWGSPCNRLHPLDPAAGRLVVAPDAALAVGHRRDQIDALIATQGVGGGNDKIITTGRAGGLHKPPWGMSRAEPIGLIEQSANRADFPGMPLKGLFYLPSFTG